MESGTHSELIDTGGVYSELWSGKLTTDSLQRFLLISLAAQETLFDEDGKEREVEIEDVDAKEREDRPTQ